MEHPPETVALPAGDTLHIDLGHEVAVEARPQFTQGFGQDLGPRAGGRLRPDRVGDIIVDEVGQRRQVPAAVGGELPPDHRRLQVGVEPGRDHGLLGVGDDHQLVDELVVGTAPGVDLLAEVPLLGLGEGFDGQHLEVFRLAVGGRQPLDAAGVGGQDVVVVEVDQMCLAQAVGLVGQRVVDVADGEGELRVVPGAEDLLELGEQRRAGERPIRLDRYQLGEHIGAGRLTVVGGLTGGCPPGELARGILQPAPGVGAHLPDTVVGVGVGFHRGPFGRLFPRRRVSRAEPAPAPGSPAGSWCRANRGKPGRRHRVATFPGRESRRPPTPRRRGPGPSRCR